MLKLLIAILRDERGDTLNITRTVSNTVITSSGFNSRYDEIEAVVNGNIDADNLAADGVTAVKLNSDVVRTDNGLSQHTDGTLQVDPSDTNPSLEISDGGLRVKVTEVINRTSGGLTWGRSGDFIFSSSTDTPTGFTDKSATYNNKFMRISSGTVLTEGGSATLAGNSGDTTLTEAQMPSHVHNMPSSTAGGDSDSLSATDSNVQQKATESTGGDGSHNHSLTSVALIPQFVTLRAYSKD